MTAYILEIKKFTDDYLNDAFAETVTISERAYLDRGTAYDEMLEYKETLSDEHLISIREVELIK